MEIKELKIVPPSGYEIDKENSTLDCIKFKPIEKKLTYDDISKKLFMNSTYWYCNSEGKVKNTTGKGYCALDINNCTSEKQAQKLLAINQLMNVAKYLNGDWEPNWNNIDENKYFLRITGEKISTSEVSTVMCGDVYFKSEELAELAVKILGEDTIRLALSTDW